MIQLWMFVIYISPTTLRHYCLSFFFVLFCFMKCEKSLLNELLMRTRFFLKLIYDSLTHWTAKFTSHFPFYFLQNYGSIFPVKCINWQFYHENTVLHFYTTKMSYATSNQQITLVRYIWKGMQLAIIIIIIIFILPCTKLGSNNTFKYQPEIFSLLSMVMAVA